MSQTAENKKSWSKWHARLHKRLKRKNFLLPNHSTLILAISGGQDSMVLLKLINDLKRLYQWHIEVWHGDHQWHINSHIIKNELQNWCNEQQISFHSTKASKYEVDNEQKARDWRYKNLILKAKSLSPKNENLSSIRILTGHTATDRSETIIMNLARGSDLIGLSTLKEERELENNLKLVRPLLIFTREETLNICKELNLPIWIDPSNENLNLTRNKIRKEVLPILNSIYQGADLRIASLGSRLENYNNDQIFLANIAIESYQGEQINSLSRKKIINCPNSIRRVILFHWLKLVGVKRITASQLEELSYKVSSEKPTGYVQLYEGFLMRWNKENIYISNTKH